MSIFCCTFAANFDYDFFRNDYFRNSALYGRSVLLRMVAQDVVLFKKNGQNRTKIGPERDSDVRNGNEMVTEMEAV